MYKLNVNGVEISVDSAADVKTLIDAISTKTVVSATTKPTGSALTRGLPYKNKSNKINKYAPWTPVELRFIWDHRELGARAVSQSPYLRNSHTSKAIIVMYSKVVNNPHNTQRTSPANQAFIESLHTTTVKA